MTRLAFLGPILMWLSIPSFVLAGSFEGVVTTTESSKGQVTQLKSYFKGDKIRMDTGDGDYWVWDAGKKEMYTVSLSEKTVTTMSMSSMKVDKSLFAGTTVARTGRSDKVAGYACDIYHIKEKFGASDVCIGKGITSAAYYQMMSGVMGEAAPWQVDFAKDGGLELRTVEYDKSGRVESTKEVTKIEAIKLDDSVFALSRDSKNVSVETEMKKFQMDMQQLQQEIGQSQQKQRSK